MSAEPWSLALERIAGGATPESEETQHLEFKQDSPSAKDTLANLARAAACLANADGGVIVLGVADRRSGVAALLGTQLSAEQVRREIHERTTPKLLCEVDESTVGGTRLLVVDVPKGLDVHQGPQGAVHRRFQTDCLALDATGIAQLREERSGFDPSAMRTDRRSDEVSPGALERVREALARQPGGTATLSERSTEDLLRGLGVLADDGRLLRAGELLLCRQPQPSTTPALVYQYRETSGGEPEVVERVDGPLVIVYERALELVSARRRSTTVNLPTGHQMSIDDYPRSAVREAVANAITHREHRASSPIEIIHSEDALSVRSPGSLVDGVTLENILTSPSRPRNPLLAKCFRMLGLAEEAGVGVDRMYREMIRSGRDVPQWDVGYDHVRVYFTGGSPATSIARFVATLPARERDDTDAMLILFSLTRKRTTNSSELRPILQKSDSEIDVVLRRLASSTVELIEPTRESAQASRPNYRLRSEVITSLGAALPYRRRTQDDIDRKIIAHVHEYGRVTNGTVRNLLEISTPRASAILRDLCDRRILAKTSEATRGPGVEYGKGPAFGRGAAPASPRRESDRPTLFDTHEL